MVRQRREDVDRVGRRVPSWAMLCPLCDQRTARRACPAVEARICAVCCGTKRVVEIACPETCGYLRSSRTHPPAAVLRQRDLDLRTLVPFIEGLGENELRLFWVVLSFVKQYKSEGLLPLADDDVADAAGALAATFETASRGLIYDHQASSLQAQRLLGEIKALLASAVKQGQGGVDEALGVILRRVERAAREARTSLGGGPAAFLGLIARMEALGREGLEGTSQASQPEAHSGLILP
jgi:hypothetical protein